MAHMRCEAFGHCPSLSKPSTASQSLFSNGFTPRSYSRQWAVPVTREALGLQPPIFYRFVQSSTQPGYALLAAASASAHWYPGATVYALGEPRFICRSARSLSPDTLRLKTAHVTQKPCQDLLRSYLTCSYTMVPVIGPAAWTVVEWVCLTSRTLLNACTGAVRRWGQGEWASLESVAAISRAVDSLAGYELGAKGYAPGSARMKPSSVAIKVSGLVEDPYLSNGPLKTYRLMASPLPRLDGQLRSICQKAKSADIVLMIDAEYSWFQPALDRIATFLSAEFNKARQRIQGGELLADGLQHVSGPTAGGLLGVGDAKWREARAAGQPDVPEHPPVWGSKAETDGCFDDIASSLVQRLANNAVGPRDLLRTATVHHLHQGLKQLRDEEGLAKNMDSQCISLSDSLRGRLMFAHSMAWLDNLTSTLTDILAPSDAGQRQPQPFVFKYLPFGPVDKVLPYLARRAEETLRF
ncbi:hypothetical protein H4Q26_010405 [Puccinia striiformis f. sp. tritici PST-130]|nr:hypothetical protein H4Q26_010405 [Puccinia striiformis f. sp. tritici PST-130]